MKQTVIPHKVIEMAKAIQKAAERKEYLTIIQTRRCGKGLAMKLANGDQILPGDRFSRS